MKYCRQSTSNSNQKRAALNFKNKLRAALSIIFIICSFINTIDAGELFKVVSDTYPPYEYQNENKIVGMDVEILQKAAQLAEIEIDIEFYPWKRAMVMAKAGKADGIFSLAHSKEREMFFYFPAPPLSIGKKRIFSNNNFAGDIAKPEDLKGHTVGVVRGNTYGEQFDKNNNFKRDQSKNQEQLLLKLEKGRYDLAVENEIVAAYIIKKNNIKGLRPLTYVAAEAKYYLGVSKKSKRAKELLTKISTALAHMKETGALETIRAKYKK